MERTDRDPDEHIASLHDEVRDEIGELDRRIREQLGESDRTMWEGKFWGGSDQKIIGYGDWSYTNSSGREVTWFLVGLAVQKNYISVYVNVVDDGAYLLGKYKDRLGKVKVGSASLSFPNLDSLDLAVFEELIGRARELA